MSKILYLDPDEVHVGWRARTDLGDINGLVTSIAELGQLQPICVDRTNGSARLVAGLRRLTACKQLHQKVAAIEVNPLDGAMGLDMQISENSRRKDFDLLELGMGLAAKKEIYEAAHPETKRGGPRPGAGRPPKSGKKSPPPDASDQEPRATRFTLLASQKLGIAESRIKEALQLAALPKKERAEIESAKDPVLRNNAAKDALRRIRKEKKRAKLEEEARKRAPKDDGASASIILHHMDNRDFFRACKEIKFDVILTDPPYQTDRKSTISHTTRSSIETDFGDWDKLDIGWISHAPEVLEPGGHLLACCPLEAIGDYKTAVLALGLAWRGAIVWHRTNPGTAHRPVYLSSCEAIVWATMPGASYHFEPWANAGADEVHNFVQGPICGGKERLNHPTQKPEWLVERILKRHAHEFSHVLDPFAGVGTTLAVCKRLGIRATGVECDDDYVTQARLRLAAIPDKGVS